MNKDFNSTGRTYQITTEPYQPRGEVGWICPVCGRGNAPSTAYCSCKMTRDITYSTPLTTVNPCENTCELDSNASTLTSSGKHYTTVKANLGF